MDKPLRVLIVEDSEDDALLVIRELERGGYAPAFERVETAEAITAALEKQVWDIVIADYRLPHFSAPAALKLFQQSGLDLPFIVVSGTIGEETAVATMKAGAHDYLMKDNLTRLVPTVERELREAEVRKERKLIQEELQIAEQSFRNSLDSSPLGIRIVTAEGELFYANQAILDIYGYSSVEELKATPTKKRYTPESYAEFQERKARRRQGKPVPPNYEVSIVRKDGEIRHLVVSRKEVVWSGEVQYQAIHQDITERKRAEKELVESEQRYRQLFGGIDDAVMVYGLQGRFLDCNEAALRRLGYRREEFLRLGAADIVHPDFHQLMKDNQERIWAGDSTIVESVHRRKDCSTILVEVNASRIEYQGESAILAVVRDITERIKMREQLIITDRLASIGELASGIAHELNNPLTSVIGFSDLLLEKDMPDDIREDLSVVNREAKRTAQVVRNLLTFARKHPEEKQSVDINKLIQNVLELRAYEQKVNNIQVNAQFAPDLPEIMADGFQLQQVFLNIVINAEHFMIEAHRRGTLTITTERAGDIIQASFADDGPGIAEENLGHLFDPFFTTKEVGEGTGLGLSISYGIITEHGGRIYAQSELGKGATFIVELPIPTADDGGTKDEHSP